MQRHDIAPLRLKAQRLAGNLCSSPEAVVAHMLAMQAQDYNGGLWSVGVRTNSCTQRDVEKALLDRTIIRTWPMRGTLHLVHADDVHWLLDLLAPRATAAAKSRRITQLGLHDEIVDEAEQVLRSALRGGRSIVRPKVVEVLRQGVTQIEITSQHTQHQMRHFGERGVICFGPNEGKQPTFVLLDEWVPRRQQKSRKDALAELARRYFVSHGPATLKDFAGWGMMTMGDAKAGLAAAEDELDKAEIDGTTYYYAPGLTPADAHEPLLLAGFDEYLLGYKDRSAVLAPEHASKIVPGGNGIFLPTIVESGRVVGTWKRQLLKSSVNFTYNNFTETALDIHTAELRYKEFVSS